ncbi:MAG: signal recognition particle-docking protein FtsY [Rhabdochlamydiaceae bacterium]|nr:signal recognition particle-docking protein FtsY [Rhabdochlamydiaceae bacterium]
MMFSFLKNSYEKIKKAFSATRSVLAQRIGALLGKPWDENTLESLEQILYEADLGTRCVEEFVSHLQSELRLKPQQGLAEILQLLKKKSLDILLSPPISAPIIPESGDPLVHLIVGINGSGKTTTIAKLASHFQKEGKKVLLGAGDTFRAAAIDQLGLWAEKLSVDIVKSKPGADPSAVAFDAISAAKARGTDIVLIDTAGRLQNKTDLMMELEKIQKTCKKLMPKAPHETWLVLDGSHGQNALDQARVFHKHVPLTGLIVTKLDGSAKGGILLAIYQELKIPIRWIGIGEKAEDLIPFEPEAYVEALLGIES